MDMQNVSNLQIPEGAVRTIHDKDNRLIWGCLAYDTKYAGNTFQQTYTGKNLWGGYTTYARTSSSVNFSTNSDGSISMSGTASATAWSATGQVAYQNGAYITLPAGTYCLSMKEHVPVGVTPQIVETTNSSSVKDGLGKFTLSATTNIVVRLKVDSGTSFPTTTTIYPMIEAGNTATDYEHYVGGTPAPNPDYPQDIHVATGSQTITLSDGVISQAYPLDLGSVELAKIGTHQDYIYKSGDDWYIHKEINHAQEDCAIAGIILGSTGANTASDTGAFLITNTSWNNAGGDYNNTIAFARLSTNCGQYLEQTIASNDGARTMVDGTFCQRSDSNNRIYFRFSSFIGKTGNEVKSILQSQGGAEFYYYLATPTDTKITDTTLIAQLDAIHQFLTRYGYDATVSGNLPLIVDKTNL